VLSQSVTRVVSAATGHARQAGEVEAAEAADLPVDLLNIQGDLLLGPEEFSDDRIGLHVSLQLAQVFQIRPSKSSLDLPLAQFALEPDERAQERVRAAIGDDSRLRQVGLPQRFQVGLSFRTGRAVARHGTRF